MGSIKVNVDDKVERQFRRAAMQKFGYGKGALSEAAEAAFVRWSANFTEGSKEIVCMNK